MTVSFATYAALIISFVSLIYTVYHNKKVGQKTNEALSYSREDNKISDEAINIAKDSLNINIINERAKNYKNFNNIFHEFKNKSTLSFNSNIADLQDLMRKNTMEINNIFLGPVRSCSLFLYMRND